MTSQIDRLQMAVWHNPSGGLWELPVNIYIDQCQEDLQILLPSLQKKDNYHQLVCQKQGLWVIYGDWKFIRKNSHVDLLN